MEKEYKIPVEIEEKLEKHSKQFGISKDDLKGEMLEYLPTVKEEYPDIKDVKQQILLAYRHLTTRLAVEEGGVRSKAIVHTAFFIGESGLKDTADKMKAKILRMTPEEQKQYHPDDDTWLDYRVGDTYLNPIKSNYNRVLYGVGSSGDEVASGRVKFLKLELWRDNATRVNPSYDGTLYKFRAIPRETDKQLPYYDLGGTQYTKLRVSQVSLTDEEKEELIRKCGKEIFSVEDIDILYTTRFKRDYTKRDKESFNVEPVFIEAYVGSIVYREDKSNIVNIYDETESGLKNATAYVPHYLPIRFRENDRVIFLADLGTVSFGEQKEEDVVLFVKGYFTVPMSKLLQYV